MKQSHQIAIIAAVGIGAYLLLRNGAFGQTMGNPAARYPYGVQAPQPAPGTAAYAAWLAQQQQNQIDMAKLGVINQVGRVVGSWFGTSGPGPGAGNMTGSVRPSTDYGMGTYTPPDTVAVNTPYNVPYTVADAYDDGIGTQNMTTADRYAIYGNDGYGFYTQ